MSHIKLFFIACLVSTLIIIASPSSAAVIDDKYQVYSGDIIKLDNSSSLYLVEGNYQRRLFVNATVFWSHYEGDWSNLFEKSTGRSASIKMVSQKLFDQLGSVENIQARSGSLVQFRNNSKVYLVFQGNKLKYWTEQELAELYGDNWRSYVVVIPAAFESDYQLANEDFIDTDNDGLLDIEEYYLYHTDPKQADTDGDGYNDGREVVAGYNPILNEAELQKNDSDIVKIKNIIDLSYSDQVNCQDKLSYLTEESRSSLLTLVTFGQTEVDESSINCQNFDDYALNGIIKYGQYYKANIRQDLTDLWVMIVQENGDWKISFWDSYYVAYWEEFTQEQKDFANQYYNNGKVDLVVTDLKTDPQPPKVNDSESVMYIYVKNIGQRPALQGVSLEGERESNYMPERSNHYILKIIWPGQTIISKDTGLHIDLFLEIDGEPDQSGNKEFKFTIDDLNSPMDDVTSNNTFSKIFYFSE